MMSRYASRFEMIAFGASLGGFDAVSGILSGLPQDFAIPITIIQHRAADRDVSLVDRFCRRTGKNVVEADDKLLVQPSTIVVAPADYHLMIDEEGYALSTDEPVNYSRPSIDVFLETAAEFYRAGLIAVLLTGATEDGAKGAKSVQQHGGTVVVQKPEEAEAAVLPKAAAKAAADSYVMSLADIAPFIVSLCTAKAR